jgi:hypothetical protein
MKTLWDETTVRYVAFLDIMGFTDLIYRNEHLVVKEKMSKLSTLVEDLIENGHEDNVKSIIFSDSILLISKNSEKESLSAILLALQNFFVHCLMNKIPIKGAISKGLFTANFKSSLFFGQPIIDAYKLEEDLQMYGVILDHKIEVDLKGDEDMYNNYCLNSPVPTKNGLITHTSINWMFWANALDDVYQNKIKSVDELNTSMNPTVALDLIDEFYSDMSGYPRKYLDNTINYINNNCSSDEKVEEK